MKAAYVFWVDNIKRAGMNNLCWCILKPLTLVTKEKVVAVFFFGRKQERCCRLNLLEVLYDVANMSLCARLVILAKK
jgi:hypothetical protein